MSYKYICYKPTQVKCVTTCPAVKNHHTHCHIQEVHINNNNNKKPIAIAYFVA